MALLPFGRLARRATPRRGRATVRYFVPRIEALEDRAVPALSVTGLATPASATALAKLLAGPGVSISHVTFTGSAGGTATASAGSFTGGNGIIGFPNGIILSNGHAKDVVGPSTNFASTDLGLPGDPDLNALAGSNQGFDATVLEFDFVTKGPNLTFQYVFGSEEYNQFVGSGFNDVFGFFLNGHNVALVPGTSQPVSINTINKNSNSQFYIDNDPADFNNGPGPVQTALNGLTKVLTVQATVTPGAVNHIKLAIEDQGDHIFDSDVFLKAGSFSATPMPIGFKPFRYVVDPTTGLFQGDVSVINVGLAPLPGPIAIALANLPPKVTLVNATGTTGGSNGTPVLPAIKVADVGVLPPFIVARVPVVFRDPPPPAFLSTFFEGYTVDILNGMAAQNIT